MKARLTLAVVVTATTVLVALAAGVSPALASITTGAPGSATTTEPMFNPANQQFVSSVLSDISEIPTTPPPEWIYQGDGAAYTATDVGTGMAELEGTAGTLPLLSTSGAGVLLLGAGALYTGWKIGSPLGGYIYKKITGDTGSGSSTLGVSWSSICASGCNSSSVSVGTGFQLGSASGFMTGWVETDNGWAGGTKYYCVPFNASGCTISGTSGSGETASQHTSIMQSAGSAMPSTNGSPCGTAATACFINARTNAEMDAALNVQSSNATDYASAPSKIDSSGFNPGTPNVGAAQSQASSRTGNKSIQAARYAIDHMIDPSWTPGSAPAPATTTLAPVYLPQPLPGETLSEYAERLRAKRYVGLITTTDDPMGYPSGSPALSLQAGTLTRIQVGTSTTTDVYTPATGQLAPWPVDPPQAQDTSTATSVQLTGVPATYVPPAGGGGVDFSPITSMGSSCNFPFGVLCWVHDSVAAFDVAPACPDLNWTMPNVDMGPLGTMTMGQHYDVSLCGFNTYMSWIRTLESFVLWFGSIWYVGSRLLGLKGGGDPTVALDEAFNGFVQ